MADQVCVTGASGFLGSHVVHQLLTKGYHVKATVTDLNDKHKLAYLESLSKQFPGRVQLYQLDLRKRENDFQHILSNCSTVIHLAAPTTGFSKIDSVEQCLDPIFQGTLGVLQGALREARAQYVKNQKKSVVRFIFVGTASATFHNNSLDEDQWNNDIDIDNSFLMGKIFAEKAAWELVKSEEAQQVNLQLFSLLFPLLLGPALSPSHISTNELLLDILSGNCPTNQRLYYPILDVRDAATACVKAASSPNFNCRVNVTNQSIALERMKAVLHKQFPTYPIYSRKSWYFRICDYFNLHKGRNLVASWGNKIARTHSLTVNTHNMKHVLEFSPEYLVSETIEDAATSLTEANLVRSEILRTTKTKKQVKLIALAVFILLFAVSALLRYVLKRNRITFATAILGVRRSLVRAFTI